jgi:hypothetical protein
MDTQCEQDIAAWADEQAARLRSGRFLEIDIEHVADEIEHVAKAERNKLECRLVALLVEMLKWQCKPAHHCVAWTPSIHDSGFARGHGPSLYNIPYGTGARRLHKRMKRYKGAAAGANCDRQ